MAAEQSASPQPLRLSTEAFAARDREAIWRDMICRCLIRVEVEPLAGEAPYHELSRWELPGLSLVDGRGAPCAASRTRELVADGNDEIMFNVNLTGRSTACWLGRDIELAPGEGVLVPTAEVGGMRFPERFRYLNLSMPRAALEPFVNDLGDALMRPIPAMSEAMRLLVGYVRLIQAARATVPAEIRHLQALHLKDLLAVAAGGTRDAGDAAKRCGIAAARLAAIKADIAASLGAGPVRVGDLAARHGISSVYVQKLFAREGTTLSAHVLEQRLLRAHRTLCDPALHHRSISAVAYSVGFDDLSHFNRSFRRRFGATPSDIRAGADHGPENC